MKALDPIFQTYVREHHSPGAVWGVVADGRLVYVKAAGVQDAAGKAPVSADTVFRIASMTKNFTALAVLKLRDQGRLSLDAPVESIVPEARGWRYPTSDSPRVTVRDLIGHTGGFITDDPWGDRQLAMSDAEFTRFIQAGPPFSRTPGTAFEYSNFGYALLGRVIANASGRHYSDYVEQEILRPLGMTASTFQASKVPEPRRAQGYRWEDEAWKAEPVLADGAFGAMGGLHTSADDYARYVAFVLDAWPARDGPESPVLKRSSVREIARATSLPRLGRRPRTDLQGCDTATTYGMGMISGHHCDLGAHLTHSGGLPGYGSNVIFLPDRGVAVFAFSNLTYGPVTAPVRDAAIQLAKSGAFPVRSVAPTAQLAAMRDVAARIYSAGDVNVATEALAGNLLLDRDAKHRNADIARLKETLGDCTAPQSLEAVTAAQAQAVWTCERGRLRARMLLAPTTPPTLQALNFDRLD